jgi:thiol-disulfide isomerase/thioredoxin
MKEKKMWKAVVLAAVFVFGTSCYSVAGSSKDANKGQLEKNGSMQTAKSTDFGQRSRNEPNEEEKTLWAKIKGAEVELADYVNKNQPLLPRSDVNEAIINAYNKAYDAFEKGRLKFEVNLLELAEQYYSKFPTGLYAKENTNYLINRLRAVTHFNGNVMRPHDKNLYRQLFMDKNLTAEQANELLWVNYLVTMNLKQQLKERDNKAKEDYSNMLAQVERQIMYLETRFSGNQLIVTTCLSFSDDISDTDIARAKRILEGLRKGADEKGRELLDGTLRRWSIVGSRPAIKFKAVDGNEVDLEKLRGKVVLIDFWATWCGPCRYELPNVIKAYRKYHDKGFEIIGISFDRDIEGLKKFTRENGMTWPQYFDGKYWDNDMGRFYGIRGIPTMWLVGKDGKVVDSEAGGNLSEKVAKLLSTK